MFKKSRIIFFLVTFAMLSALISACDSSSSSAHTIAGQNCQKGSITFDGSTALYPLANAVASKYQDACSEATITPKQSESSAGLKAANDGTVQIGNSDTFADAKTYPALIDHQVAAVVFSVVLNPQVTGVTNLSSQQLIDIYAGTTTNWKDIGGPDLGIVRISRSVGSGTRATFEQYVLNGGSEAPSPSN